MIQIITYHVANLSKAEPGETFTFKGQQYTVESLKPYVNDAGKECVVVSVSTFCGICGEPFEVDTRRRPKWLPKTCGKHPRPNPVHAKPDAPQANVGTLEGCGVPPSDFRGYSPCTDITSNH
jgi:hypothetical protein